MLHCYTSGPLFFMGIVYVMGECSQQKRLRTSALFEPLGTDGLKINVNYYVPKSLVATG